MNGTGDPSYEKGCPLAEIASASTFGSEATCDTRVSRLTRQRSVRYLQDFSAARIATQLSVNFNPAMRRAASART